MGFVGGGRIRALNQCANRILTSLPAPVFAEVRDHLDLIELSAGHSVAEVGALARSVYFPYSAVISLVVELSEGDRIETAMVGRDGLFDALSGLGERHSLVKAVVHRGGTCGLMGMDVFRKLSAKHDLFRASSMQYNYCVVAETRQSAACNARHSVEARICRWLLRLRDLTGLNAFTLNQEALAQMLGVRRPTISVAEAALRERGLISYFRGQVHLRDIDGLRKAACGCYETVRSAYGWAESLMTVDLGIGPNEP